jgi:phosphotransferase system HPr (HPr) family protein
VRGRAPAGSSGHGAEASGPVELVTRLRNRFGLHVRPAGELVKLANSFEADVTLIANGAEADAKSVLDLMVLEAGQGDDVRVRAKGADAEEAARAIAEFLGSLPEYAEGERGPGRKQDPRK